MEGCVCVCRRRARSAVDANVGGGRPRHRRPPCQDYAAKRFLFIVMGPPCPMLTGERCKDES